MQRTFFFNVVYRLVLLLHLLRWSTYSFVAGGEPTVREFSWLAGWPRPRQASLLCACWWQWCTLVAFLRPVQRYAPRKKVSQTERKTLPYSQHTLHNSIHTSHLQAIDLGYQYSDPQAHGVPTVSTPTMFANSDFGTNHAFLNKVRK